MEAQTELLAPPDLGPEEVPPPRGMHVEVVGRGGAATEGELGQADPRGEIDGLLVEAGPDRVKGASAR